MYLFVARGMFCDGAYGKIEIYETAHSGDGDLQKK